MEQKFEGIFAEITRRSELVKKILSGETSDDVPDGLEGSFSGPVIDENIDADLEIEHLKLLLEKHIGLQLEEAAVAAKLESVDKKTKVEIFGLAMGSDGDYYLSRWQNEGEKPSYVLWPKEMYDVQLIGEEENEAPFVIVEGEWE